MLSSDAVVHELYRRPAIREAVVDRLGHRVLGGDGEVDRAALGAIAFGDPEVLGFLERLLHPLVAIESERFRREAEDAGARDRRAGDPAAVRARRRRSLRSHGADHRAGRLSAVRATRAPRARRQHQLPEDEKRARADEVFVNDGSLEELDAWVADLVRRLGG